MSNIHIHHWYTTRSLSLVLFVIYLDAALRDLRDNLPQRPGEDTEMPYYTSYADDVDNEMNESLLVACQYGILTSMKPRQNVPTFTEETRGRARHSTEKATCSCCFPEPAPLCILRPPTATVQCVYGPCVHIQHGHLGINTNGMGQV